MKKGIRISRAERIMAIKRLPEFKDDYERYLKIKGSPDFLTDEFKRNYTLKTLCEALIKDGLYIRYNAISELNQLLKLADLYNRLIKIKTNFIPSKDLKERKDKYDENKTEYYLKELNRLLLEEVYPQETPKKQIKKTENPDLISNKAIELDLKWGERIEAIEVAEIIYKQTHSFCIRVVHMIEEDPIREFAIGDGEKVVERWIEGNRLYLKVDIKNATKYELIKDFKRVIDQYDDCLKDVRKSKKRTTKLDHWTVWDMHNEGNQNLLTITKNLCYGKKKPSGKLGNPTYNKPLMKKYKNVQGAYNRAKDIIESVIPNSLKTTSL
jgi:hypothetical protein